MRGRPQGSPLLTGRGPGPAGPPPQRGGLQLRPVAGPQPTRVPTQARQGPGAPRGAVQAGAGRGARQGQLRAGSAVLRAAGCAQARPRGLHLPGAAQDAGVRRAAGPGRLQPAAGRLPQGGLPAAQRLPAHVRTLPAAAGVRRRRAGADGAAWGDARHADGVPAHADFRAQELPHAEAGAHEAVAHPLQERQPLPRAPPPAPRPRGPGQAGLAAHGARPQRQGHRLPDVFAQRPSKPRGARPAPHCGNPEPRSAGRPGPPQPSPAHLRGGPLLPVAAGQVCLLPHPQG